jgi:hypothetical protein
MNAKEQRGAQGRLAGRQPEYAGPRVSRVKDREQLMRRREATIQTLAKRIHAQAVLRWAAQDEAPYPTLEQAQHAAAAEVDTLMRGLGQWAAADPLLWRTVHRDAGVRPSAREVLPWIADPWEIDLDD